MSNNENFRNVIDISERKEKKHTIKNNVVIPFLSGVLGCSLVIGTCFGVPEIREKVLGEKSTATSVSNSSVTNTGVVDLVSLKSYSDTSVYAANKILPSIVGIEITFNVTQNSIFSIWGGMSSPSTSTSKAAGSGIIISEDGYILTNNHVVDSSSSNTFYTISDATSVKVTLSNDDKEYEAKIIGKDEQTDLAVLKIDAKNLTAAEFADSDSIKVGEFAMAVGNPLSLGTTITCGVVSALNREITDSAENRKYTCIQTDAPINSGNSGGALVNSEGKVIGVNTLKMSSTGVEGIGFAIPINSTKSIVDDLIKYSKVRRPQIGINARTLDEQTAKRYDLVPGVYVISVEEFSAAESAGIQAGDIITAIDGKEVKTKEELDEIKFEHAIGDKITLSINRKSEKKEISLTLQESK